MKMMLSKAATLHSPSFSSLNVRLLCKHKMHKHAWQREHFVISGPGELFKRPGWASRLGCHRRYQCHCTCRFGRISGTLRGGLQGTFPTFRPRLRAFISFIASSAARRGFFAPGKLASWQLQSSSLRVKLPPVPLRGFRLCPPFRLLQFPDLEEALLPEKISP